VPKKIKNLKFYQGIGRRKEAVAQVRLYLVGKTGISVNSLTIKAGDIVVNKLPISKIYTDIQSTNLYFRPLRLTDNLDRFAISILVKGGGKKGQLEAIVHGIARALEKVDREKYRPLLKKQGLLKRDARIRERRKVGTGGKARRLKQSPKR
jgi:small subunit ribosomal protein S9